MHQNIKSVFIIGLLCFSFETAYSSFSFSQFLQEHEQLRSSLKSVVYCSSLEDKNEAMAVVQSKINSKNLPFERLTQEMFGEKAWNPTKHAFNDSDLVDLFSPYQNHDISEEEIFLANILYTLGAQTKDLKTKKDCWEKAASLGHAAAQYEMFHISYKEKKSPEAKNYIFRSASQGYAKALERLTSVYEGYWKIDGVERDLTKALSLCREVADQGDENALFALKVSAYTEGTFGTERNFQTGVRSAKLLADEGNKKAKDFIESFSYISVESLTESNPALTQDDFLFLKDFLGWDGLDNRD